MTPDRPLTVILRPCPWCGRPAVTNPCSDCRRDVPMSGSPLLCITCRAHLGWWPEDDPRCPQCRYLPITPTPKEDR